MLRLVVSLSLVAVFGLSLVGCVAESEDVPVPDHAGAVKTAASERAERRLYDGAPPVIPHRDQGRTCVSCHHQEGVAVSGLGFAPPSPHEKTIGLSALSNCRQCHVAVADPEAGEDEVFVENSFAGLRQDLRRGRRLNELAPPVVPHPVFMRENCQACHAGPAAREEIRTSHPERAHCSQCHVEQTTDDRFPL